MAPPRFCKTCIAWVGGDELQWASHLQTNEHKRRRAAGVPLPPEPSLPELVIPSTGSWEEQALSMCNMLGVLQSSPDPEKNPQYQEIIKDITKTVKSKYPNCTLHVFGSTCTGLACEDSDIDVYLDLAYKDSSHRPTVTDVKNLFTSNPKFQAILDIPTARVPILKMVHKRTKILCDIIIKNNLSVMNSQILKYYIQLDPKLKLLFSVLKQFTKVIHINNFTVYAMQLATIHYLSSEEVSLVPKIEKLLISMPTKTNLWNSTINPPESFYFDAKIDLKEMLKLCFEFLSKFNFATSVMCTLTSTVIAKEKFLMPQNFSFEEQALFQLLLTEAQDTLPVSRPACIQDPIELSHNTTRGLTTDSVVQLQGVCLAASIYCEKEENDLNGLFHVKVAKSDFKLDSNDNSSRKRKLTNTDEESRTRSNNSKTGGGGGGTSGK